MTSYCQNAICFKILHGFYYYANPLKSINNRIIRRTCTYFCYLVVLAFHIPLEAIFQSEKSLSVLPKINKFKKKISN